MSISSFGFTSKAVYSGHVDHLVRSKVTTIDESKDLTKISFISALAFLEKKLGTSNAETAREKAQENMDYLDKSIEALDQNEKVIMQEIYENYENMGQ